MAYGYVPPGRIVELNNLARLRRLNGAFHGAKGAAIRYDLLTNERLLFNASPTTSDVIRGASNYLFRYGGLTPEQWGQVSLELIDPPGNADLAEDLDGVNTVVHFPYTTTNTSLQQGFELDVTTLYPVYVDMTANTWHVNIVFKMDSDMSVGPKLNHIFGANGLDGVGLFVDGNDLRIRANDDLNYSWTTDVAPVADGWAGAYHRVLLINNSGYLSVYVDGTLQVMQDSSGAHTATVIELGLTGTPKSPPAADWVIGNASAHVNTMTFHQTDQTTKYYPMRYKYIAVGDALTDPVILNSTIQLTEPSQQESFTETQVRPVIVVKSTQEDDTASGYKYPVNIGLQYGTAGAIDLHYNNTRIAYLGADGIQAGKYVQGIIAENTTLDDILNVEYGVRTDLGVSLTITMPTFTNVAAGSHLYFYDLDGSASSGPVTIDMDNANTGYTINGESTAQVYISQDWGAIELTKDARNENNWLAVSHAPSTFDYVESLAANTTLAVPSGPGVCVVATTGAASRTVKLPIANTCLGKTFFIKKGDTSGGNIWLNIGAVSGVFDMPSVTSHQLYGRHDAAMYTSDGTSSFKTWRMCQSGSEDVRTVTANTTMDHSYTQHFISNNPTITMPTSITGQGRVSYYKKIGAGNCILDGYGGEMVDDNTAFTLRGKYKGLALISRFGSSWSTIGYVNDNLHAVNTTYTVAWPCRVVLADASGGSFTVTLPAANDYGDTWCAVRKIDSSVNTVVIEGSGAETIDGDLNRTLNEQWDMLEFASDGTTWHVVGTGDHVPDFAVSNSLNVNTTNGIDINPGSDTDADLITVGVTDAPTISWDESEDAFALSKSLNLSADLIFTGSDQGLPHGEIYAFDTNTTITISGTGIANKVQVTSFATDGESSNMTPDHTNDHITVVKAGKYLCTVSVAAESIGGTPYEIGLGVFKNNGATHFQNLHAHRNLSGGGVDVGSISMSGIIDLAASDTIEVWVWNETNTNDVIVDDITLSLVHIAGT